MEADAPAQTFAALIFSCIGNLDTNALSGACWRGDPTQYQ